MLQDSRIDGNGLLFRFEGRFMGIEPLPRAVYGSVPYSDSRFWISYLRVGELFVWKESWYQVVINKMENINDQVQSYVFFAIPESGHLREE